MAQIKVTTNEMSQRTNRPNELGMLAQNTLDSVISTFDPIQLREMDAVALLNRVDTKYVLSTSQLIHALQNVQPHYRILTIDHRATHAYQTLYFDTRTFALYHDHVTGRSNVYKVRAREYVDTRLSYFEVKHKDQKKRTEKSRMPIARPCTRLDGPMQRFLQGSLRCSCSGQEFEPKLWNTFHRITLVNKSMPERLTIDLDLRFSDGRQVLDIDGIAIAEVKQDQWCSRSAFVSEMRRQGIRQTGFSKYCFGVSQLYPTVKANSQKERVLLIEKLQHGGQNHVCFA